MNYLLTIDEVADHLRLTSAAAWDLIDSGALAAREVWSPSGATTIKVRREDLEEFLAARAEGRPRKRGRTKEECIAAAGRALVDAIERLESRDPHEAAIAAYQPGGPSVAEIEARIRRDRGDGPTDTSPPTG
ncbi:helix-turn-helix domain-containing protein [Modestobacter sp. SSW1-42]|uniref:helix-turn-helix domain-containing protein n=1 Tax=Modestobacter sp. SSW1-42 TaxID=596372 RepID=UPI003987780F